MIIEVFGGITPHALAHVGYLARRAKGKGARDGTRYGSSRSSMKSYFVHHAQRLSTAACVYDAKAMRKALGDRKQKLMGVQPARADARDAGAA